MLRFVLGRLLGAVVVLWAIVTISFFLMRFAPGSPFDADRRLPPAVEANKWIVYGMGREVVAPVAGTVALAEGLVEGGEYPAGTPLGTVTDAAGVAHPVAMPTGGKLVSVAVADGEAVPAGARVAVVPRSLASQYLTALGRYARLDFGVTISSDGQRTVRENLALGLPISLELGLWSLFVAMVFGVSAGLYAGLRQNTWADYAVMSASMVGISVPTIVSGPVFILIFVFWLDLFPYGGWETAPGHQMALGFAGFAATMAVLVGVGRLVSARGELIPPAWRVAGLIAAFVFWIGWFPYGSFAHWHEKFLPILTLGLVYTAAFARLTRGGMLDVIRSDYIRTARAKGLDERTVVVRHAMKGAILPTVTFLGPAVARIVTGSIVVERVFGIPGLAEYFVTPALNRDYPMVIGVVVLYSSLLVLMNLLVDIAYTFLDPRVSYD